MPIRSTNRTLTALVLALPLVAGASCAARHSSRASAGLGSAVPSASAAGAPSAPQAQQALTFVIGIDGLGLFREERLEAARLVAEWARKRGLRVVDPDAAERVFAAARVGKDPSTGNSCGRPLADFRAATRYQQLLGATGELSVSVGCDAGACSLSIRALDEVGFFGAELMSLSGPYAANLPWRQALTQALAGLPTVASSTDGTGALGLLEGSMDDRVVARPEKLAWGVRAARDWDWTDEKGAETKLLFNGKKDALRRCFLAGDGAASLLIEADQRGKVTRCESRDADDQDANCVCQAFMAEGHARDDLRGRRMLLDISFTAADVVTPKRAVVEALSRTHQVGYKDRHGNALWRPLVSDPSIESWETPPNSALAVCFASNQDNRERVVQVTVEFDAKGKVARTHAVDSKDYPATQTERECVERVFRAASAPCPAVATTTAQAAVYVSFRTIGSMRD